MSAQTPTFIEDIDNYSVALESLDPNQFKIP